MLVVGQLRNTRNLLIRLSNEEDFITVMAHGNVNVIGIPYKIFHSTPDFDEDTESLLAPVWISLPDLPPNYFHVSMLKSIGGGFGHFLKHDNATACVSGPKPARI